MKKSARIKKMRKFEPNITIVKCEEKDVVCVKVDAILPASNAEKIHKLVKECFPKNEVLVLDKRVEISIIQKS